MKNLTQLKLLALTFVGVICFQSALFAQCEASFTYTDNGDGNVIFQSTSTGHSLEYTWNFGDGNTSHFPNPTHTYEKTGNYIVCLTISSDSTMGCFDTFCDTVFVEVGDTTKGPCEASFTYTDNGNGNVKFQSTSTGPNLMYAWSFGDGQTSQDPNPTNSYAKSGIYSVCLWIFNNDSTCNDYFCDSIFVEVDPGPCQASYTYMDKGNGTVKFLNTSSSFAYNFLWDFDDGTTSTSENPTHNFQETGYYYVCLTIEDTSGGSSCSDTFCDTVFVEVGDTTQGPCEASFTYKDKGNGTIKFRNTSTGESLDYTWYFGDGNSSHLANPIHEYEESGFYNVVLNISSDSNSCFDSFEDSIYVKVEDDKPCEASFIAYQDSSGKHALILEDRSKGAGLTYFWDFGDGNSSKEANPTHTYKRAGTYTICLTVTGAFQSVLEKCEDTYCKTIQISQKQAGSFSIKVIPNQNILLGTNDLDNSKINGLTLFPNPVRENGNINIDLSERMFVEVFVTDILGNTVSLIANEDMVPGNNRYVWNTDNLENGIYLLNVKTEGSTKVEKFVLNR